MPKPEPLSADILILQGSCCGNGCLNCPYLTETGERHVKGTTLINQKYAGEKKNVTTTKKLAGSTATTSTSATTAARRSTR